MINIILVSSRNIDAYNLFQDIVLREIVRVQYDLEVGRDEITFHVPDEPRGGDYLFKKFCRENELNVKFYKANWNNLKEQPCLEKPSYQGMYNGYAGFNRNTRMVEQVRTNGGGVLLSFETRKKDTSDVVRKAGTTNNIEIRVIDCKGKV